MFQGGDERRQALRLGWGVGPLMRDLLRPFRQLEVVQLCLDERTAKVLRNAPDDAHVAGKGAGGPELLRPPGDPRLTERRGALAVIAVAAAWLCV